jgi:hypothetical protein
MERFVDRDLTGAEFRECVLDRARFVGVVLRDAEIDGLVGNLVVNGVEVMGYVEAELDRRHPERPLIRSAEPAELHEGWRALRAAWATTIERLRAAPGRETESVNDEWSAVQTLRHLVFVHDTWFRRCVLGSTAPVSACGLPSGAVPDAAMRGLDPAADPSLDEVLTVREEQAAELDGWLAAVAPEQLAGPAPVPDDGGWPTHARGRSVLQCLHVVLEEEWAHHAFCVRDLDLIEAAPA